MTIKPDGYETTSIRDDARGIPEARHYCINCKYRIPNITRMTYRCLAHGSQRYGDYVKAFDSCNDWAEIKKHEGEELSPEISENL